VLGEVARLALEDDRLSDVTREFIDGTASEDVNILDVKLGELPVQRQRGL
jgi:hypothetical protein